MTAELISLRAAAERLGLHYMTVYRYVRTGRLDATKRDGQWYVDPAALAALADDAPPSSRDGSRSRAAAQLEARLLASDEAGAWSVVSQALTSGAEPADIHLQLLIPAMQSIGRRWAAGEVSVFDEHQATAVAARITARLGPRFHLRQAPRGHVVVGLVTGDTHALTTAMIADLLRSTGVIVTDLGADTPTESFLEVIEADHEVPVTAVAISVSCNDHLPAAADTVATVRSRRPNLPIAVGGTGVTGEAEARALGATIWTPDVRGLLDAVDELHRP